MIDHTDSLVIEALSQDHQRGAFDCGVAELNRFLHQQARQKASRHIAKTFVANAPEDTKIKGYYTLTGYSVTVPPEHPAYKKYPHPLSAVKLARLAVDLSSQKQHIGARLLVDAIIRTAAVDQQITTIGLFVDPMTVDVVPFYEQYGFLKADPGQPSRLEMWLPIRACLEVAGGE